MPVPLLESLATTEALAEVFSDHSILQAMLDFEVALAKAEADLKIIPRSAASAIAAVARPENFELPALARETLRAGTPAIPLVKALRAQVKHHNSAAADFVHWGATSQDVSDTALILLLQRCQVLFEADLDSLEAALSHLVARNKDSVMLGRTLLQAAPPVTFGLKAAGWLAAVRRAHGRLNGAFSDCLLLQLGGASGTLAALGNRGGEVAEKMAKRLKLGCPEAPWHAHRDRLAALVCACGILTGTLGKIARDISLLMQTEVGEGSEPGGAGRGGSSTMPQKRNPIASAIALAAASRVPGMVSAYLSQMVQEHERAVGGIQAEWATLAGVVQATGVALSSMAEAVAGLAVNRKRMLENLKANRGAIFAEKATLLLTRAIGRESAHGLLEEATDPRKLSDSTLSEILIRMPEVQGKIDPRALRKLEDPKQYLGMSRQFTERLSRSGNKRARRRKD